MNFQDRVAKTSVYGKIFGYQRSLPEVYHWLIGDKKISYKSFTKKLGSKTDQFPPTLKKNKFSIQKIKQARHSMLLISKLPLIYFLGLTGSVSANNAKKNDDIDFFVITAPHTLWIVRPILLCYLEIKSLRRRRTTSPKHQKNLICTNLWMDLTSLQVPKKDQNIYTAHEVLQVYPLVDKKNSYQKFIKSNSWTSQYLANAYFAINSKSVTKVPESTLWSLLFPFNLLLFIIQKALMYPSSKGEKVSYYQAFFHDQSFSQRILARYNNRKINYNKKQ